MTYTVPAGRYGDYSTAFIQAYIDAKIAGVLDTAPEALDTLNELAAAIGDDASFLTTMASANTNLQTNIDTLSTAAATARTNLQTLLQNAVDAVQADVDTNETTSASAFAAEASARGTALTNLQTTLQGLIDAVQADVDANELASDNAETALSGRLDTLEADPTTATAVAAVQADVDANETASDAAETALSGRLDVLEADPTTKTYVDTQVAGLVDSAPGVLNTLDELAAALGDDANFATTVTNSIAAVQADVDANETSSDVAEAALSARIATLEVDPTTATALAAVQADVDQNESDADAAVVLKAAIESPTFTTKIESPEYHAVDSHLKFKCDTNDIIFYPNNTETLQITRNSSTGHPTFTANGGSGEFKFNQIVELAGGAKTTLTDAADDGAAATAGVAVGQLYRNGSVVMIRVS